jgi:hypothetical protein
MSVVLGFVFVAEDLVRGVPVRLLRAGTETQITTPMKNRNRNSSIQLSAKARRVV